MQVTLELLAVENDVTLGGWQHAGHDASHGRLTAARFTDDADHVAIFDADIDIFQDRYHGFTIDDTTVTRGHILDFNIVDDRDGAGELLHTHAGFGYRPYRFHQAFGIGMLGG